MSAGLTSSTVARSRSSRAVLPAIVLLLGAAGWLILFRAEAAAAIHVWRTSTAFGHCFLILPVAAWLAWERRGRLTGETPDPRPWVALAAVPIGLAWFVAERLGIMEGRQLAAMALLLLLVLCVLGWRLWRAFAVPLLYLFFLVPFGASLVQPLQTFTARFIDIGLDVLGIPHVVTRFTIEIPEGMFRVAEACAGLRFLIASVAFGVLYACVMYRSPMRRLAFIVVSAVVPVIANGVRALGIVFLGHLRGSAEAGAVDHIVYGWVFFSVVLLLLILAGLPFREAWRFEAPARTPPRAARDSIPVSRMAAGGFAVLLLSAAGPTASGVLDGWAAAEQMAVPESARAEGLAAIRVPPGCRALSAARIECGGTVVDVSVQVFAARTAPSVLIGVRRALTGEASVEDADVSTWTLQNGVPRRWQVVRTADRLVATCLWVAGRPNPPGLTIRGYQALASIGGTTTPPRLVAFSLELPPHAQATSLDTMRRVLESQTLTWRSSGAE